jgi:alkanesulfonate monooxygenase SsuD/methylene tetrahydromethanopterin reductase-like flavin-dependent oxidoreductase (luciferase family)
MLEHAARLYRESFKPSEDCPKPHFIAALNVIAADTTEQAQQQLELSQRFRIRQMLGRGRDLTEDEVTMLMHSPAGDQVLSMAKYTAVGTVETVRDYLDQFRERVQADELILTNAAPDLAARHRTLQLLGEHVIARG